MKSTVCVLLVTILVADAFHIMPAVKCPSQPQASQLRPLRIILQAESDEAAEVEAQGVAPAAPPPAPASSPQVRAYDAF